MNLKLNKRAILPQIALVIVVTCILISPILYIHKHLQLEEQKELNTTLHMQIEQLKVEHEEDLAASNVTIQYLNETNLNINKEREELQTEVDELKKVIKIIADNLKMSKEDLISSPNISVSRKGGDYLKTKTMTITAYTAGYESTGKTPNHPAYGITKSGAKVKEGRTIACPPNYPLGTKIYIPFFDNAFTCEDRGSAIVGDKLDVYMKSVKEAREFGKKELEVRIIKWGE